jgi:hypothetical protein
MSDGTNHSISFLTLKGEIHMEFLKAIFGLAIAIALSLTTFGLVRVTWETMKLAANSTQVGLVQLGKWNRQLHGEQKK